MATPTPTETTFETREVLAGAYRGRQMERAVVTHDVRVDDGVDVAVSCGRVPVDHMVDTFAAVDGPPTCARCRRAYDARKAAS